MSKQLAQGCYPVEYKWQGRDANPGLLGPKDRASTTLRHKLISLLMNSWTGHRFRRVADSF